MKIPIEWLKEFVDVDLDPVQLADRLTMWGFEVEGIEKIEPTFSDVVVGEILEVEHHPGSQNLTLCKVDAGTNILSIVCGAPNVAQGQKVPCALVGARLSDGTVIEKRKIRGVESPGMLCSEQELGLSDDHSGIFVLEDHVRAGQPLDEALGLDDSVLDVNVPPNRGDCQSILGIAREVAGLLNRKLSLPAFDIAEKEDIEKLISLSVVDTTACPRYVLRMIKDMAIVTSPFWMRMRISKCGMRPINSIVDVTNYVMLELGQPLHAFDYKRIRGHRIEVRVAGGSEIFRTLDGVDRRLEKGDVLICDGEGPVAIAGIMGGENSEIVPGTSVVALESAFFNPLSIRKTARRLDIKSEASLRFEKGIDLESVDLAARRAIALMSRISGGTVVRGSREVYERKERKSIYVDLKRLTAIIGVPIEREKVVKALGSIGIPSEKREPGGAWFSVPSFRHDINEYIDLIEEVSRIYGFENIPATVPVTRLLPVSVNRLDRYVRTVKDYFTGTGFYEVINYGFFNVEHIGKFLLAPPDARCCPVSIINPISKDLGVMRTFLTPGILENVAYNVNRGTKNVRLFEVGKVFHEENGSRLESMVIGFAMAGREREYFWREQIPENDLFDLKGVVEGFLDLSGLDCAVRAGSEPFLAKGEAADILVNGVKVGWMGALKKDVTTGYEMEGKVYCSEISLDRVMEAGEKAKVYKPISRFPSVVRDFSFHVDEEVAVGDLVEKIRAASGLIVSVGVFDMFKKERRSVAFRVVFQSYEETLRDETVNELQQDIINRLTNIEGIALRT